MAYPKDLDELTRYVVNIFSEIELELMKDIAMRLISYDSVAGTLENHIMKLSELNALNANAIKIIAKYSGLSEKAVRTMLENASVANIIDEDIDKVSPLITGLIDDSVKDLNGNLALIQTKAIESAKDTYMRILDKAFLEVSSGVYSYDESIRRGVREMARNGLTGATYRRSNGHVVNYSIESVVRRDTLTAVNQLANKVSIDTAKELGYEYMEVSSHFGARHDENDPINDHVGWQGKVYKLDGFDKEHDNFYTATGYGQLLGLAGVNCRHRAYPYKLGSARASEHLDENKSNELYKKEQKQRRLERQIRTTKKEIEIAKAMKDDEQVVLLKKVLNDQQIAINQYCKANDLKRDFNREMIASEIDLSRGENGQYLQDYNEIKLSDETTLHYINDRSKGLNEKAQIETKEVTSSKYKIYLSNNIHLKRKRLHDIESSIDDAINRIGKDKTDKNPTFVICSNENMSARGKYDISANKIYIKESEIGKLSHTLIHELYHWKDSQIYLRSHNYTTFNEYLSWNIDYCRKMFDKLNIELYDVEKLISLYAYKSGIRGRYDEVMAEYRALKLIERSKSK